MERPPSSCPARHVLVLVLLALAAGLLDVASCASNRAPRVAPVASAASERLAEARLALEAGDLARAREAAERAAELAPDWVAPRRVLDDLARRSLRGPEALGERLRALEESPDDAGLAYLAGRLEGAGGVARLERATRLDRSLAWPWHGVAWNAFLAGDARAAVRAGRRAVERARDPWEHAFFAQALARYLLDLGRHGEAVDVLEPCLDLEGLPAADRVEAATWLAVCELAGEDPVMVERGYRRAIRLLETSEPNETACRRLVRSLFVDGSREDHPGLRLEIDAALAVRGGPGRDALRAEILFEAGPDDLAFAQLRELRPERLAFAAEGPVLRAARLAAGDTAGAIDGWLATLPLRIRDLDGLPRETRLRRIVEAARAVDSLEARAELGEALLAAGWFREARGQANHLSHLDLEAALDLEARAARGRVLLLEIARLFEAVDGGEALPGVWGGTAEDPLALERRDGAGSTRITSVDDLLVALQPLFERFHGPEGGASNLPESPRLSHGLAATVVHPGPWFSARDEADELGEAGTVVPGLAEELAAIGRFGIFGQAVGGGGPDGTLRRALLAERVEGEHLGVPFSGTVIWCQGADLPSRPARSGARITGAALHEGYWIDVEQIRDDWRYWYELERRAYATREIDPATALAGRGPSVRTALGAQSPGGRRMPYAVAGLGDLLRLSVLADRARSHGGMPAGVVSFGELVEVTAIHEEGHLCDRTRFLPLTKNLFGALGLLFDAHFSPQGIAQLLEYRAQLVCLCSVPDPRIPLADTVDAASNGGGITPHGPAYRRLLVDLLEVLDGDLESYPGIDGEHFLVHQLHHLGAEEVRALARELARRKGMDASGE